MIFLNLSAPSVFSFSFSRRSLEDFPFSFPRRSLEDFPFSLSFLTLAGEVEVGRQKPSVIPREVGQLLKLAVKPRNLKGLATMVACKPLPVAGQATIMSPANPDKINKRFC